MQLAVKTLGTLAIGQQLEFPGGLVATITATFNALDDVHTVAGHTGCDVAFAPDTVVPSAVSGTVAFVSLAGTGGWSVIFGNSVIIDHGDGTLSLWAHFRDAPLVQVGDRIDVGMPLGVQGNTGQSRGAHVHIGWTTSANPSFLRDAQGGCSRLLNAIDYIGAAPSAQAVMTVVEPSLRDVAQHAVASLKQWEAYLDELLTAGAPDIAVRSAATSARAAVDAILAGVEA